MQIKVKPMGQYQTNCYILTIEGKDYIIDPGMNATEWVVKNCKNPVAILNTHGHFDHVWSNKELSEKLNIPIYCPKDDAFMLSKDPFKYGVPPSKASVLIKLNQKIEIENTTFTFWHFPGHTPGCSVIEYNDIWFSGDFLFEGSIGRWDFPYSNRNDMLKSLQRVKTTLKRELKHIDYWINVVKNS